MNEHGSRIEGFWWSGPRLDGAIAVFLLVLTFAAYYPVLDCQFVNYDDNIYVTENGALHQGLSGPGIRWAFTAVVAANWHPLTLLSLLLDYDIFEGNARGYHLVNLLLHLANTLLCFHCLRLMTGAVWRSAMVAALFALHPLHVEAVAWVSQRKELLSTFFGLLALRAYVWYVARPSWVRMACVAFALTLGLLAKPLLVTFPFLLLLLDYWPLGRYGARASRLLGEKAPLFCVAAAFCLTTLYTQVWSATTAATAIAVPTGWRIANAFVSYVMYLRQTIVPIDLAILYPHPGDGLSIPLAVGSTVFIGTSCAMAWLMRRKAPYVFVGWWWFVGMLIPVIGLVQVGEQSRADRYTYVPLVGLFVLAVWGGAALLPRTGKRVVAAVAATMALICLGLLTHFQIEVWHDSRTLWKHALAVTGPNPVAHYSYGTVLLTANELPGALEQYNRCISMRPNWAEAYRARSLVYREQGQLENALGDLTRAIELQPANAVTHGNRGSVFMAKQDLARAVDDFNEAIRLKPDYAEALVNRGQSYKLQRQMNKALPDLDLAIGLFRQSRNEEGERQQGELVALALIERGTIHQQRGDLDLAQKDFEDALKWKPNYAEALYDCGTVCHQRKQFGKAVEYYTRAIEINPDFAYAFYNRGLAYQERREAAKALEDFRRAAQLKPDDADLLRAAGQDSGP